MRRTNYNYSFFLFILLIGIIACRSEQSKETENINKEEEPSEPTVGLIAKYVTEIEQLPINLIEAKSTEGMVFVKEGEFMMGADNVQGRPDELPKHPTKVNGFWIDATEVTNAEYTAFVEATNYVTTAEKEINIDEIMAQLPPNSPRPNPADLQPFSLVFKEPTGEYRNFNDWWEIKVGASWQHPQGAESDLKGKENLPAVHLSWYDAVAFCKWKGKRLPTEAEWEFAARGGLSNNIYPWGNEKIKENNANYWQGKFPEMNEVKDGFRRLSPVKSFPANGYGLYDMSGNVWEWVSDWYRSDYYQHKHMHEIIDNPKGPNSSYDPDEPSVPKKIVRGGSFLCNDSYCSGFRVAARMKSSPDTGLEHTGCRCVRDGE